MIYENVELHNFAEAREGEGGGVRPHPNAHLIEGPEILTDISGLTPDLVHPADNAMIEMGANPAQRLKRLAEGPAQPPHKAQKVCPGPRGGYNDRPC